jgi:hypothetical protein
MKKKKQTYSKVIPALAFIGGAYLLLTSKSGAPPIIDEGPLNTGNTGPFIPSQNEQNTIILQNNSSSQVSGTEILNDRFKPDYNLWRGYDWYLYVENLSKNIPKREAISIAYKEWNSPENQYYYIMPNELSFLMGLAMAEKMPFYNQKGLIESGDYGHINTGADAIGFLVPVDRPIKWDSQPVYDTHYGWWYDIEPWSCQDWVDWHRALERKYSSTRRANEIWRTGWFSEQNNGWNAVWMNNADACPMDCANFVKYFASKGIKDTGGFFGTTYCDLSGIVENIIGTVESGTEAIANTSKVLKIAIPVAVIAIGYYAYKNVLPALQKKYIK